MAKKLKEQLEIRKQWLLDENMNYSKKDFTEDWKNYSKAIENNRYLELISLNVYDVCKAVLMDYMHLLY